MTRVSTPNNRKSRLRRVYSVTWVAMALVALESSRFARLLRMLSGLSICESTMPMAMTPIAAAGSTARATPKSPDTIRSDWRPVDRFPTALAGGRAVHREELLEMPEPLGGLEGPVGPEEPGDDACTGHCQRLFRDRRAEQGADDAGGEEERQCQERDDDRARR